MADANTTFRAAARTSLQDAEFLRGDGRQLYVYYEVQPPIGGLLRGVAFWEPTAADPTPPRVQMRLQAYADLLRNAARSRRNHGSLDPADADPGA